MLSEGSGFREFLEAHYDGFNVAIPAAHPCFAQHVVRGHRVFPGVCYLDLALGAVRLKYPAFGAVAFEDCVWTRPLLAQEDVVHAYLTLEQPATDRIHFEVRDDAGTLANGWITTKSSMGGVWEARKQIRRNVEQSSCRRIHRHSVYESFSALGIDYGPFFRRIEYVDIFENRAVAQLVEDDGVSIHLTNLLDCAFQSGLAISIGMEVRSLMPFSLGALVAHERLHLGTEQRYCVVTEQSTPYRTNIGVYSDDGRLLLSVIDLGVRPSRL